jgi:putative membrane protein
MKFSRICVTLLGTTIACPALLVAQFDPNAVPASQTQANRPQQQPPSTTSMQDSAPNSGDVGQAMQDKMFLRKAAEGGIAEVKLGQLATQKGSSDDVKAFGQKMVDDHTRINLDMAQVADTIGVRMPKSMNKDDQAEYDKLNALSGNDFDIEYLTFMVKDHHKDLHEFRLEAASAADPALHDAVVKAQSVIHEHAVMVDKLAREKGIPMPPRGGNKPPSAPTL